MAVTWVAMAFTPRISTSHDHTRPEARPVDSHYTIAFHYHHLYRFRVEPMDLLTTDIGYRVLVDHLVQCGVDRRIVQGGISMILGAANTMFAEVRLGTRTSLYMDVFLHQDEEEAEEVVEENMMEYFPIKPASEEAVRSLKREKVQEKEEAGCSICMEVLQIGEEMARMPCSHAFHDNCIVAWLQTRYTCPLCRFPLPVDH